MTVKQTFRNALLNPAWVSFLWVGMSIGIGVIETPARFATDSITRPIALDVGRNVFTAFNKVEIATLFILLVVVRVGGRAPRWWWMVASIALIVLAQSIWLLPELSNRASMIIAGKEPPASYAHAIYSSLEMLKVGLLLYLGFASLTDRAH